MFSHLVKKLAITSLFTFLDSLYAVASAILRVDQLGISPLTALAMPLGQYTTNHANELRQFNTKYSDHLLGT